MGQRSPLARAPRSQTRQRRGICIDQQVKALVGPIVLTTDASVAADCVTSGTLADHRRRAAA
ncbi:hypothetical protein ACSHXN_46980 (plasmid) [Streptomyces sp. HUAS TT11]|uniref:hypothetical protein n=1 Tax=Streptomyces sp. HUAS TT11 TaxID=3447508 RepID=UPI003F65CA18